MSLPHWIKSYIQDVDLKKIEQAITEAEKKTSGEIVPIVVKQSTSTGHIKSLILLLFGLGLFLFLDLLPFVDVPDKILLFICYSISALLAFFLGDNFFLQRSLTRSIDQHRQTELRAFHEFYLNGLQHTDGKTGILIFISLMERKVFVLADKAINDKIEKGTWENVVEKTIKGIKNKDFTQGLINAIHLCGNILEPHFPIQPNDINELKNSLIIKE